MSINLYVLAAESKIIIQTSDSRTVLSLSSHRQKKRVGFQLFENSTPFVSLIQFNIRECVIYFNIIHTDNVGCRFLLVFKIMHRPHNQHFGFSFLCGIFDGDGSPGGIYCIMGSIYKAVPFHRPPTTMLYRGTTAHTNEPYDLLPHLLKCFQNGT